MINLTRDIQSLRDLRKNNSSTLIRRLKSLPQRCEGGLRGLEDLFYRESLTDFKRRTNEFSQQLKETGNPLVLTVNGKAEFVVQTASAYQELLETVERMETIAGVRRGLEQMKEGKGRPAHEIFAEMSQKQDNSDA